MKLEFRLLKSDEIECRPKKVTDKSVIILLYKDARCDQNILDETVGALNWQRHHTRDNANCIVSIWDDDKKQWIEKEDTGTESNTEAEKGLASDSFKRACFNWGIGRELYTSPKIYFPVSMCKDPKYDKFKIKAIAYEGKTIKSVTIEDIDTGHSKTFSKSLTEADRGTPTIDSAKVRAEAMACINKLDKEGIEQVAHYYHVNAITEMTTEQCQDYINKRKENMTNGK